MTGPASPGPSDRQLADIVGYLARLCLEAERGLRAAKQLTRFMEPDAALRFRGLLALGRYEEGPIRPTDVGPPHLTRHADGTVFATVVTRTEGHRWGALSLKLRERDGRFLIADIRRVLAATRRPPGRVRPVEDVSLTVSRDRRA